jgi:hypothetical protein
MARKSWLCGLLIVLTAAATVGCTRNVVQQKPPPDPLLVSVKVASKPQVAATPPPDPTDKTSRAYPQPPGLPDTPTVTPASRLVPLQPYKD